MSVKIPVGDTMYEFMKDNVNDRSLRSSLHKIFYEPNKAKQLMAVRAMIARPYWRDVKVFRWDYKDGKPSRGMGRYFHEIYAELLW